MLSLDGRMILGKYLLSLILLAGLFSPASAEGWVLVPCPEDSREEELSRLEFERQVRTADPDTSLFTLHPFPRSAQQKFEAFMEFHSRIFSRASPESLPRPEKALLSALLKDRVRYEVLEVENWTPLRCGHPKARLRWSVLRMFDKSTGSELARASVDEAGHVGKLQHAPSTGEGFRPTLLPSEAQSHLSRSVGGAGQAQLVATWGSLRCDVLNPCVAMRNGDILYILHPESRQAYRIRPDDARFSFREDLSTSASQNRILKRAADSGGAVISLGADVFALAEPISTALN